MCEPYILDDGKVIILSSVQLLISLCLDFSHSDHENRPGTSAFLAISQDLDHGLGQQPKHKVSQSVFVQNDILFQDNNTTKQTRFHELCLCCSLARCSRSAISFFQICAFFQFPQFCPTCSRSAILPALSSSACWPKISASTRLISLRASSGFFSTFLVLKGPFLLLIFHLRLLKPVITPGPHHGIFGSGDRYKQSTRI